MSSEAKGIAALIVVTVIWGLSGIYFKALKAVPPLEMLSHRTVWCVVFLTLVLAIQGRLGLVRAVVCSPRTLGTLCLSALFIAANWLLFIHAVQSGHALEASLGYYIFPLFAVGLGYFALGERFSSLQRIAITLAVVAVLILTFGLGVAPYVAVAIALTFSLYGLIKKRLDVNPIVTVLVETLIIAPFALLWLWHAHHGTWHDIDGRLGGIFGHDLRTSLLLMCASPMTGVPLILFTFATRRIPYATVGLVQYINPTLQFFVAVALFGEPFTRWHAIAFPLIWAALALYSWDSLSRRRFTA